MSTKSILESTNNTTIQIDLRVQVLLIRRRVGLLLIGPNLTIKVGDETPDRNREGDTFGAIEWLVEEKDGKHLGDRDEQCHDDTGEQRRAVEDGTNRADKEALESRG